MPWSTNYANMSIPLSIKSPRYHSSCNITPTHVCELVRNGDSSALENILRLACEHQLTARASNTNTSTGTTHSPTTHSDSHKYCHTILNTSVDMTSSMCEASKSELKIHLVTPLMYAVCLDDISMARILIRFGADITSTTTTPITGSVSSVCATLSQQQDDSNSSSSSSMSQLTAMSVAIDIGNREMIELLKMHESKLQLDHNTVPSPGAKPDSVLSNPWQANTSFESWGDTPDCSTAVEAGRLSVLPHETNPWQEDGPSWFTHTDSSAAATVSESVHEFTYRYADVINACSAGDHKKLDSLLRKYSDTNHADAAANAMDTYGSISALSSAINSRNEACVKSLLQAGANPNMCTADGEHPLLAALHSVTQDHSIVSLLIHNGANVNATAPGTNESALIVATRHQMHSIVQLLLENDANVHHSSVDGMTAIEFALTSSIHNLDIIRTLLHAGACVKETYIRDITKASKWGVIAAILDPIKESKTPSRERYTALCTAVEHDNEMIAENLLGDYNACPNEIHSTRLAPLSSAIMNQNSKLTLLLLHHGADVNYGKRPPLLLALYNGVDISMIECLLEQGANPNVFHRMFTLDFQHPLQHTAVSPICMAILENREDIFALLLRYNVDVNAVDEKGHTSLMCVISRQFKLQRPVAADRKKWVNRLINEGADITMRASDGTTALSSAFLCRDSALVELLLERDEYLDMNLCDPKGRPLSFRIIESWAFPHLPSDAAEKRLFHPDTDLFCQIECPRCREPHNLLGVAHDIEVRRQTEYGGVFAALQESGPGQISPESDSKAGTFVLCSRITKEQRRQSIMPLFQAVSMTSINKSRAIRQQRQQQLLQLQLDSNLEAEAALGPSCVERSFRDHKLFDMNVLSIIQDFACNSQKLCPKAMCNNSIDGMFVRRNMSGD
jgi:ankyrin repeat protein